MDCLSACQLFSLEIGAQVASQGLSAYESLKVRGYDVAAVIFEDHGLMNEVPLLSYFWNRVPVLVLPPVPQDMSDDLINWFDKSQVQSFDLISQQFDACASWWTQGPDANLQVCFDLCKFSSKESS
ncbi:Bifunctional dethiobiotin synthetase/7 [Abeliophyllum distichum]|uniref:Bifunctional dethiobiotin synthetase/7 n=1 Tax=Abeliophyllum distichum TaxID=126358 RepID=A0ABD1VBQ6_9LAMI